jgi:hypothetical protein
MICGTEYINLLFRTKPTDVPGYIPLRMLSPLMGPLPPRLLPFSLGRQNLPNATRTQALGA